MECEECTYLFTDEMNCLRSQLSVHHDSGGCCLLAICKGSVSGMEGLGCQHQRISTLAPVTF